jgi:NADH-quinone oxidoreductase subunit J
MAFPDSRFEGLTNTESLGRVLYTDYIFAFQVSGLILLVAMIGAIVLTLRHREGVKRQNVSAQIGRTRETGVEIRKVRPGEGL